MQADTGSETVERQKKTPIFLRALLVLTSVNITLGLFIQGLSFSRKPNGNADFALEDLLSTAQVDLSNLPEWVLPELLDLMRNFVTNYSKINITELSYYLLLIPAVVLMFKKRVAGYYVYVVVQVLGILYLPILLGTNKLTWMLVGYFGFWSLLFIVLYSMNRKHLS